MCNKCLKWTKKEYDDLTTRVTQLKKNQIIELFKKAHIDWLGKEEKIAEEMIKEKGYSQGTDVLLSEAVSKNNLIKWINYFENQNK